MKTVINNNLIYLIYWINRPKLMKNQLIHPTLIAILTKLNVFNFTYLS